MNKELMIKAAIKFKGAWPDDNYDLIIATPSELVLGKIERDGSVLHVSYVSKGVTENISLRSWSHCTREQFEAFVEALFDGAPEDAEFYSIKNSNHPAAFWRVVQGVWHVWLLDESKEEWLVSSVIPNGDEAIKLIPRPAKKLYIGAPEQLQKGVTPQAPYIPKIGEEIEYKEDPRIEVYTPAIYCGYVDGDYIVKHHKQSPSILTRFHNKPERMRPIITERQQRAVDLYRMVNNDGLQDREIMRSDKFNTYLNMWDTLVKIQRGES